MPLIPNKREFLARRLRDVGVVALIERLARRPGLLVLTYHRIGDPAGQPFYAPVASASAEGFEAELVALRRTHRVIGQDDLPALADNGFRVHEPTALVTFDDGYRDNHDVALPVLKALRLPATFFLVPAFLSERPRLTWWDHIAYVVGRATVPLLRLERPAPLEIDLTTTPRADAISRVVWAYFDNPAEDERSFRAGLEDRAGVDLDEPALARDLFMTWDQARDLIASGMSVGSHSLTHRVLGRLTTEEQRAELVESKRVLESELGLEVTMLAYPYGWPGTFDATTARLAREAGYRLAFSSVAGFNRSGTTDSFSVRRLGVGFADAPVVHRARWALHEAFGGSFL